MQSSFRVRFFLILCALACPAGAQFSNLAVDANAANVWFSANLRLRTDPAAPARLLYKATGAGVSLMPGPQDEPATRTSATVNSVSDDADVVVWTVGHTGDNSVPISGSIPQNSTSQTVIHRYSDGREWSFAANIRLSRNGRWAWVDNTALNLQTGETVPATGTLASRDISDEGDAVILQSGRLGLLRPGGAFRPLPDGIPQTIFLLDRQAAVLVWSRSATPDLRQRHHEDRPDHRFHNSAGGKLCCLRSAEPLRRRPQAARLRPPGRWDTRRLGAGHTQPGAHGPACRHICRRHTGQFRTDGLLLQVPRA
ncbi:MAG: hypothetical protein QM757_30850 [Paludibaculum sp.]